MKALVLAGGGSKGVFQVGVLRHLVDTENADYDLYVGSSVGALNAAVLAQGELKTTLPELEHLWLKEIKSNSSIYRIKLLNIFCFWIIVFFIVLSLLIMFIFANNHILSIICVIAFMLNNFHLLLRLYKLSSLADNRPLEDILKKSVSIKRLCNSSKELIVGAVSMKDGTYYTTNKHDKDIYDWIMASSSFPVFFEPRKIGNNIFADGGLINIAPVQDAINYGATEVDVILVSPIKLKLPQERGIIHQLVRAVDILTNEVLTNDLEKHVGVKIRFFVPREEVGFDLFQFNPKKLISAYNSGKNPKVIS